MSKEILSSIDNSPEHVFGFSSSTSQDLENLINILKHSSDLPKGFCVIATYKLPIESIRVVSATLAILQNIDINNQQDILFATLLSESLFESSLVKKLTKKSHCQYIADIWFPLFFSWIPSFSEETLPLVENIYLRCLIHIKSIFKTFPLLISKKITESIQDLANNYPTNQDINKFNENYQINNIKAINKEPVQTESGDKKQNSTEAYKPENKDNLNSFLIHLEFIKNTIRKLKFRKLEFNKKGFLDFELIITPIVQFLLNRVEMDELKQRSIILACEIYRIVESRTLMERYINSSTIQNSPLTLSILDDNFNVIEEDIQNYEIESEIISQQQEKIKTHKGTSQTQIKSRTYSNWKDSQSTNSTSQNTTQSESKIEFNESSSISKELLKSKLKRSQSQNSIILTGGPSALIKGLSTLTHLNLESTNIKSIDNLQFCTNLRVLYMNSNQIRKIEGLDKLIHLTQLYLQDNYISKIEGLNALHGLKKLNIERNYITSLEGMTQNRLLTELYMSEQKRYQDLSEGESNHLNQINSQSIDTKLLQNERGNETGFTFDLTTLYNLQHSLSALTLSNCNIKNASDLSILNNIQKLDLSKNDIENIDSIQQVLSNYSLYDLDLSDNPICKIPKYRDKIIIQSTHSLQILDGKPIQANVRSFLINKKKHQMSLKPNRSKSSIGSHSKPSLQDETGDLMTVSKPKIFIGARSISSGTQRANHSVTIQNLDIRQK